VITLTEEERDYTLGKSFFVNALGEGVAWDDVYMVVINVLGDNAQPSPFDFTLTDLYFGHHQSGYPFVVYTEDNIVGPRETPHLPSEVDGTLIGDQEVSAGYEGEKLGVTIENIGIDQLVIDEIELVDTSGAFIIEGFEPSAVLAGDRYSFDLKYLPNRIPGYSDAEVYLYVDTDRGYMTIPIRVSAKAVCPMSDHITTTDVEQSAPRRTFKARQSIGSNAHILGNQEYIFEANLSISLESGFQINHGTAIQLISDDGCSIQE